MDSTWYNYVDLTYMKEIFIHRKVALTPEFINFLNENHLKTQLKFRKLYLGLVSNEMPDETSQRL